MYHRLHQFKPHSSPWFSAACAVAIFHRNHFFHLYQQNKSSKSKVKFGQASNHCKRDLEATKLTYATKTKESIKSKNQVFGTFGELLKMFLTEINLLYLLYSTTLRCCLFHLIKKNHSLKTFLRTLILVTAVYTCFRL